MNENSTDILMCPVCGYELILKAKAVTTFEDADGEQTIYGFVFPYHEGDVKKGIECPLSLQLVDPKLRAKYPREDTIIW